MKVGFYTVDTRHFEDGTTINIVELGNQLPFVVKRVYSLVLNQAGVKRGAHAHLNQTQLLYALSGHCIAKVWNQFGQMQSFDLSNSGQGLLLPQNHWIEIEALQPSVLVCLASEHYQNLQTLYNKSQFLNQ
ncbi:MAG: FdtA/QdtA family cupin domain-containing protein [Bacteroidia bacterium]|nr:FdtA/QdtA family cupin domain-containing protein [Bacteroidia bacterium]